MADDAVIVIHLSVDNLADLEKHLKTPLQAIAAVTQVLDGKARLVQARAVRNVSGVAVTFNGRTWTVNRQTGKLARSIQVLRSPLARTIVASAEYSAFVEEGTRGPVDLKKTRLAGKIVPLPVSKAAGKAIVKQAAQAAKKPGLLGNFQVSGFKVNVQKSSTGKVMGTKYIVFRRVPHPGQGSGGWIIPKREARPFMGEAADHVLPSLATDVAAALATFMSA